MLLVIYEVVSIHISTGPSPKYMAWISGFRKDKRQGSGVSSGIARVPFPQTLCQTLWKHVMIL